MVNSKQLVDQAWGRIECGRYRTPDGINGKFYTVINVSEARVTIMTNGGNAINMNRASFVAAIGLLIDNNHYINNPCVIGANKTIELAGPLCVATRTANDNTRMISSYIIPILRHIGLVDINGGRPNSTWLVT